MLENKSQVAKELINYFIILGKLNSENLSNIDQMEFYVNKAESIFIKRLPDVPVIG